ncbi:MAG: nicotinate-nucleotide adenylyltransferase [bacterium]
MRTSPDHCGHWGILGGTFDPVHNGHLALADDIIRLKELTGVLLVPSVRHPLKQDQCRASFRQRVVMLKLALANRDNLGISLIETEQNLSGYTLDTIRALKRLYPKAQFSFIVGADNLVELNRWRHPDRILKEVRILAGSRPGIEPRLPTGLAPDRIELVATSHVEISSTDLRRRIAEDNNDDQLDLLMPAAVWEYIRREKLYR